MTMSTDTRKLVSVLMVTNNILQYSFNNLFIIYLVKVFKINENECLCSYYDNLNQKCPLKFDDFILIEH